MKFSTAAIALIAAASCAPVASAMKGSAVSQRDLIEIPSAEDQEGRPGTVRKARGIFKGRAKKRSPNIAKEEEEKSLPVDYNAQRELMEANVSIDGVADLGNLSGAEIMFLEDAFKAAYNSEEGDWTAHSALVMRNGKVGPDRSLLRGNNNGRDLLVVYDVDIFFDGSCRLCPDDDDVIYTRPPRITEAPSQAPSENTVAIALSNVSMQTVLCSSLRTGPFRRFRSATNCQVSISSLN